MRKWFHYNIDILKCRPLINYDIHIELNVFINALLINQKRSGGKEPNIYYCSILYMCVYFVMPTNYRDHTMLREIIVACTNSKWVMN